MDPIKLGQRYYPPTPLVPNKTSQERSSHTRVVTGSPFAAQLQQTLQKPTSLKFSQHAQLRLAERGIDLSTEQLERLQQGMHKAQQKGAQESLFIMEDVAFVVSVRNQTVITALDKGSMNEQVITNIDSALLL